MINSSDEAARDILEAVDLDYRSRGAGQAATRVAASSIDDEMSGVLEACRSSNLVLVLGAGVSYAAGLPMWHQLLADLAEKLVPSAERSAFELIAQNGSSLATCRLLKEYLGVPALFASSVKETLYGGSHNFERPNSTLEFVVTLCDLAVTAGARIDIITYNFDDLLEQRLQREAISFVQISSSAEMLRASSGVNIFHVHGFLAERSEVDVGYPDLVFSEDEFHILMNSPAKWQNQIQQLSFESKTCLFVGLSMVDPNLRRLLDFSRSAANNFGGVRIAVLKRSQVGEKIGETFVIPDANFASTVDGLNRMAFQGLQARISYVDSYDDFTRASQALRVS